MCSEKMSYTSQSEAVTQARVRLATDTGLRLFVYPCPHCGYFHLTKARRLPAIAARLTEVVRTKSRPSQSSHQFTVDDLRQKWGKKLGHHNS